MVCADPLGPPSPVLGVHLQASMPPTSDALPSPPPPTPFRKAALGLQESLPYGYRKPEHQWDTLSALLLLAKVAGQEQGSPASSSRMLLSPQNPVPVSSRELA